MCEITELNPQYEIFECVVTRTDVIQVKIRRNLRDMTIYKEKLNLNGKDNKAELAKYIAENFQDNRTNFYEKIGIIETDGYNSNTSVKGIEIKVIDHDDRKAIVKRIKE
jgi:hypothetical protein